MQTSLKLTSVAKYLVAAGLVAGLAACGGGGGDDPAPPAPQTLTVTGTAAVGKALDGATISVTCRSGSGTATSGANGSYSVTVSGGTADAKGPCVLKATHSIATLNSLTPGAGVANITPLTDLLANYLATRAGTSVSNLLSNATSASLISNPAEVQNTANMVVNALGGLGVTGLPNDFLTASLVPPAGGTPGNAQDQALERLRTAGLVGANGVPTAAVATAMTNSAIANRVTGATGAN